jgi:PAS domain S-box-containing protein
MGAEGQKTILLVDDEVIIVMAEKLALEKYGYKVITANSGEKAVTAVEKMPVIDLVLMDINLGAGMDGTEAAAIILRQRDLPVVFLSSHMEPGVVAKTEKITSYGYVVKNSSITVLDASIKMAFKLFEAKMIGKEKEKALRMSEERFRTIVANTPDHIIVQDHDLRYRLVVNPQLGLTEADMLGKTDWDILGKKEAENLIAIKRKVLDTGEPFHLKTSLQNSQGASEYFDGSFIPKFDPTGKPDGLIGYFRNVTERVQAERELRDVIEKNPLSIQIVNREGFTLKTNLAHTLLFGAVPPADFSIFNDSQLKQQGFGELIERIKNGEVVHFPVTRYNAHDSVPEVPDVPVWIRTVVFPISDSSGKPENFVFMHENITERKQAEEAQRDAETRYRLLFELSPDGIVIIDPATGRLQEFNETAHQQLGYTREEFARLGIPDLEVVETPEETRSHIARVMHEGRNDFETRHRTKQGDIRDIHVMAQYTEMLGRPIYHCIWRDITERKRMEAVLRESEERYRDLVENSQDLICTHDLEGKLLSVNEAAARLTGYPLKDLLAMNMADLLDSEVSRFFNVYLTRIKSAGRAHGLMRIRTASGEIRYWEYDNTMRSKGVAKPFVRGMAHDITERKRAEEEKKQIISLQRATIESTADGILVVDQSGKITDFNQRFARIWDIPDSVLAARDDMRALSFVLEQLLDPKEFLAKVNELYDTPEQESFDLLHFKDGRCFERYSRPQLISGKAVGRVWSFRDISERKRVESELQESEERYRTLVENASDIVYGTDKAGRFTFVNRAALTTTGFEESELIGKLYPSLIRPDMRKKAVKIFLHQIRKGMHNTYSEFPVFTKDGREIWLGQNIHLVMQNGQVTGFQAVSRDITERKQAEAEIKRQLAEKEILLREVHHRIKNNIASIGGLLTLHMQSVTNPEASIVLQDAMGRVNGMRILYDKLLLSEDYKDISVKHYLEDLIDTIIAMFSDHAKIKFEKRIADFHLDPKRLFPIGIIINELLTNIMKYAFTDKKAGQVKISMKNIKNHVTLSVQDNGIGLPEGFDIDKSNGFGLMLVKMLSQQLGGSFIMETHAGTRCKVEFDI